MANTAGNNRVSFAATDVADVCYYDTTKDSDNGAWTRKVQGLSYYNEALNQTYRGVRQGVPSKMQIVASVANGLQINDADDPTTPMWDEIYFPRFIHINVKASYRICY